MNATKLIEQESQRTATLVHAENVEILCKGPRNRCTGQLCRTPTSAATTRTRFLVPSLGVLQAVATKRRLFSTRKAERLLCSLSSKLTNAGRRDDPSQQPDSPSLPNRKTKEKFVIAFLSAICRFGTWGITLCEVGSLRDRPKLIDALEQLGIRDDSGETPVCHY